MRSVVDNNGETGFTLMETLVAMMILVIALVVILQLFSQGLRSGRLASDYTRGVMYGRELMENILLLKRDNEGIREGEIGGIYRWRAVTEAVEVKSARNNPEIPLETYRVTVQVRWMDGNREKSIELTSLKLGNRSG